LPLRGNSPCVVRAELSHTGLQPLIKPGVFRQTEAPGQNAPEPAVGKNNFEELLFHCHSFSYSRSYSLGVQTVPFLKHGVWAAFRMGIVDSRHANGDLNAGFAEGCIEYLQKYGFKNITIMEGSWVGDNTKRAFRVTGYDKIAEKYGVKLMDLKDDRTRPVDTAIGKINVCATALDTDYLISLPVLKGHCQTTMTCALKNSKGCPPSAEAIVRFLMDCGR